MTDYAQATAADPAWTWWMTTAAAAAVRMRNLRHDHLQQTMNGEGSGGSDVDDEYAGSGGKRQRFGHADDEYWPVAFDHHTALLPKQLDADDAAAAGPLDLSVKATLMDGRVRTDSGGCAVDHGYTTAVTPEKRPVATACVNRGGKSSKKTAGGTVAVTTAVKAATRKLLPQLMLDRHRVDRSSPVSGTIIVPAAPLEEPAAGKQMSSSSSSSSPPPLPLSSPPYADCSDGQDEYDGGDIDPEFNVVVATDEARRQIDSIPNALGPYRCRLCGVRYADAFALARHRCRCIVHVRYTCPECDKVFQCPANLASHRRWHGTAGTTRTPAAKPTGGNRNKNGGDRDNGDKPAVNAASNNDNDTAVNVNDCADGGGGTTVLVTTASGFKKNMLQRAVQAAAAAANNNNNDDNDKNKNNDIAK